MGTRVAHEARARLSLVASLTCASRARGALYPMEGGNLRREKPCAGADRLRGSADPGLGLASLLRRSFGEPGRPFRPHHPGHALWRGCRSRCSGSVLWAQATNALGMIWNPAGL